MEMNHSSDNTGYHFSSKCPAHTHRYLWDPVTQILRSHGIDRLFDLGCGNGAFAFELHERGLAVTGIDPSEEGIELAKQRRGQADHGPDVYLGSAYDDLPAAYGQFPCVVSLEVVEHVYFPRKFAASVHGLLEPGGIAIISTPYHGYTKNLALAAFGKLDNHFTALWDHGHIKFWSVKTLSRLFSEQNMQCEKVIRVGRIPILAKSMILVFRKK